VAVRPGARPAAGFVLRAALRGSLGASLRAALGRRRNPLWRPLDRSRGRARLLLVLGLLGALLFGCAVAGRGVALAGPRAGVEAARTHLVDARVLGPARPGAAMTVGRFRTGELVRLGWTYPAGHPVTVYSQLAHPLGTGAVLPVWVTDEGLLAAAPPDTAALVVLALGTGTAAALALGAAVLTIHLLYRRLLRRRIDRHWTDGWAAVEPHWSGRLRGRPDRS
jgi:hypothetical protein